MTGLLSVGLGLFPLRSRTVFEELRANGSFTASIWFDKTRPFGFDPGSH